MFKIFGIIFATCITGFTAFAQSDEIWQDAESDFETTTERATVRDAQDVVTWLEAQEVSENRILVGGYVQSVFREFIDSVQVSLFVDHIRIDSVYTREGFFKFLVPQSGKLIDLRFSHPDFHPRDTSLVLISETPIAILKNLEPRFKILLKGRAYAGNIPLEGVDVTIRHLDGVYTSSTRGCYYDKEDYWNCLFHGMFKQELTADDPSDSIHIELYHQGMKPLKLGMTFSEYQGEIMELQMKYESMLPEVPMNNVNLKLAFPFMSVQEDWFVGLSYYRLLNNRKLRRVGLGVEGSMYISNLSIEHKTFEELDPIQIDSSYIRGFVGPSAIVWLRSPENRKFSTYMGGTMAINLTDYDISPQAFVGTRLFLDLNKAVSFELRYAGFDMDLTHYRFNPYGNSEAYLVPEHFDKIHATLGIQIVF